PEQVDGVLVVDALPFYPLLTSPDATVAGVTPLAAATEGQMLAGGQSGCEAAVPTHMAMLVLSTGPGRDAVTRAATAAAVRVGAQAIYDVETTDIRPRLAAIRCPVEVLYAWDASMGFPQANFDAMYRSAYIGLIGAQLTRIDHSYHFIMIDQPD